MDFSEKTPFPKDPFSEPEQRFRDAKEPIGRCFAPPAVQNPQGHFQSVDRVSVRSRTANMAKTGIPCLN